MAEARPITDQAGFDAELAYLADRSQVLIEMMLHRLIEIDTVCMFAQSEAEYDTILAFVRNMGPKSEEFSHVTTEYVAVDMEIAGQPLKLVGVREHDPTRPERGYGDYSAPDFKTIVDELVPHTPALDLRHSGRDKEIIEVIDIDFDVRGYVVDGNAR